MHDATKVVMGSITSNIKKASSEDANPAVFKAGFAVRRATDGGLQFEDDDTATLIGVSLGPDLSDCDKTAVCRSGYQVPLRLKLKPFASGTITIDTFANLANAGNDEITVGDTTFVASGSAVVLGDATFRAFGSDAATATSLAAQINAHEDTSELVHAEADGAVVHITALERGEAGNEIALAYSDEGTDTIGAILSDDSLLGGDTGMDTVEIGAQVFVDEITGEAVDGDDDSAVATGATYLTGPLTGVYADGSTYDVALINMLGGL